MGPRHPAGPGRQGRAGRRDGPEHPHPGARAPPGLRARFGVDHTQYDTTSILATIERAEDLPPLTSRDAAVNNLFGVFRARSPR